MDKILYYYQRMMIEDKETAIFSISPQPAPAMSNINSPHNIKNSKICYNKINNFKINVKNQNQNIFNGPVNRANNQMTEDPNA